MGSSSVDVGIPPFCIIPAAGRSSRMGRWKPLLPWHGGTLCQTVIEAAVSGGCQPVLVAGYKAEELLAALGKTPGLVIVINKNWELGMLGSILAGAELASGPGFLVAPADMPFLPPALFRRLVDEAERRRNLGERPLAIFAAHGGELGHPVWIPAEFLPAMKRLPPDGKLREFLLTQPWTVVEAETDLIRLDLDSREEYEKALALSEIPQPRPSTRT